MAQLISKISTSKKSDGKSGIHDLLFKYLPYWPVFIFFLVLCVAGAWFYLRITPPQYEITASIMLKDDNKGAHDGQLLSTN